jgi:peptidoglycan hydrolase-like protein with peptidoglycan-binding domain
MKDSYSNSSNRNGWISYTANMRGAVLKVWSGKIQAIEPTSYRPSTPYTGTLPTATVKSGVKGDDAKACQTFLNWCDDAKLSVDGNCGNNTVKAIKVFQKTYGLKLDGSFGSQCRKKANEIIKEHEYTPSPYDGEYPNTTVSTTEKVSRGPEIVAKAKEYAWPYGTASSKYSYSKGSAKPAYKTALKKYMNKSAKVSQSDCGYFVSTCVRASGIAPNFLALKGTKEAFPKVPSTMSVVHKGKAIPSGLLKPGDIIRYKKTNGHQHTLMCYANGKIAEAGREHQFPAIESDTKKYNKSNVKLATLEVIRANPTTKTVTRSYLQRGDRGEEIKKLQKYINWFFHNKYGKDVLTVDGKYGVNTENYAKLMQSELGFKDCDGLIGPKTVEAMKGWRQ